jgi:tRNA dimethylallyltransferase
LGVKKFLIVVAGPTAVGKTSLTVNLAKKLQCEIVSADSRQFFKELSIGTAKPTLEEMGGITHHFIDFLSIHDEFSAGMFELSVLEILHKLFTESDLVIMTGGSGLYIQAVCEGMNNIPSVDARFRQELYEELSRHGLPPLLEELKVKDPVYFQNVDIKNTQRIIRALEICRGSGMPYSAFREDKKTEREFEIIKIGLDRERHDLFDRINRRMDEMIAMGLFEEAKNNYPNRNLNALKTVGYKEIFDFLDGKYDMPEAVRLLKRNSRRYAKRQLTWFNKDQEFVWFHPDQFDDILFHIHEKVNQ